MSRFPKSRDTQFILPAKDADSENSKGVTHLMNDAIKPWNPIADEILKTVSDVTDDAMHERVNAFLDPTNFVTFLVHLGWEQRDAIVFLAKCMTEASNRRNEFST